MIDGKYFSPTTTVVFSLHALAFTSHLPFLCLKCSSSFRFPSVSTFHDPILASSVGPIYCICNKIVDAWSAAPLWHLLSSPWDHQHIAVWLLVIGWHLSVMSSHEWMVEEWWAEFGLVQPLWVTEQSGFIWFFREWKFQLLLLHHCLLGSFMNNALMQQTFEELMKWFLKELDSRWLLKHFKHD